MTSALTATPTRGGWFGHPRGLSTLFFTEMWERFSYYGMRAFLILYMTAPVAVGGLGFDVPRASSVYGTYTGSVWVTPILGGLVADRSEEHTSELQSLAYLVCRLLLEK